MPFFSDDDDYHDETKNMNLKSPSSKQFVHNVVKTKVLNMAR